ncbi:MAG: hypothetical protein PW788_04710 [Micavibrio sp.]|nr:hypothetical protein [Micavibrio sp.]
MRNPSGRNPKPILRSLTLVFLIAGLGSESLHVSEERHNPHGNRRERIEELRQRTFESLQDRSLQRNFNSGGNPPPDEPVYDETLRVIRRRNPKATAMGLEA